MLPPRPLLRATSIAAAVTLTCSLLVGVAIAESARSEPALLPDLGVPSTTALRTPPLLGQPNQPDKDPFYRPPADFADAAPGDLLRYRVSQVYLTPGGLAPAPVHAWQVLYRSSTARGEPDAVSGTVLVPLTPWTGPGPRPIVGYAVGTHGLGDQCAPSYAMATGTDQEYPVVSLALSKGWAVAETDYEGLGTPGDHTYTVAVSEGRAVLDIVRTATRIPEANLSRHAPIGIWGYSQGGGAAGSAGEQARTYAPELHTVGVAEGGVPGNLRAVLDGVDGGPSFALLAGAIAGFDTAYAGIGVHHLLNASGGRLLHQIRHECAVEFPLQAGHHLSEYTKKPGLLDYPPLVHALWDNRLGGVAPDMPVRLYWAQLDELIPASVTQRLLAEYCTRGVRVQFVEIPGVEHITGGALGAPSAVDWLADRFAHRPAPDTCSRHSKT